MSDVTVKMNLSPTKTGALYMKFCAASDRVKELEASNAKLEKLASELINMDLEDFESLDREAMHDAFGIVESTGFLNDGKAA